MKISKKILFIIAFILSAIFTKAQTGTCGSPKAVTNGACTAQDTFNLAPYYAKFTASTDTTVYQIAVYIQGLSTHPNYSVKLYNDSCSHLATNELPINSWTSGDTVYVFPQVSSAGGHSYLIEMKNNNTSPSSKTYYSICLSSTFMLRRGLCPTTSYGNPIGCNMVCNGDFECTTSTFTTGLNNLAMECGWFNANPGALGGTCDAFSSISSVASVSVPCNYYGYEFGQGPSNNYAGFIPSDPSYPYHEYMETKLISPLVAGQTYIGSFWLSRAEKSTSYPSNVSVFLTNGPAPYTFTGTAAITLTPVY
ncbi:MAG TPA: hypothetical protein VN026_11430, partial [Bacteroidia bacterium]|nr:hypothetical protein [Bacteroidia bacterium]